MDEFHVCMETKLHASVLPCFEPKMIEKRGEFVGLFWAVGLFDSCLGSSGFRYWHTEWES